MEDTDSLQEISDQDNNKDVGNECDVPSDFYTCPFEDKLGLELPEVLLFIKRLQNFLRREQSKLNALRKKFKEHKSRRRKTVDAETQTEIEDNIDSKTESAWSSLGTSEEIKARPSLAEEVKAAAQNAMQQTGFVYEETSGMYYDYNTGYYYNAELGLYYDGNSGTYYYYDEQNRTFHYHSQVEVTIRTPATDTCIHQEEQDHKRKVQCEPEPVESKKQKHENNKNDEEPLEEGECSDSSEEDEACSPHEVVETEKEVSKGWPPCIRIIVKETSIEQLKVGTLFVVPYTGGTMGREGDHAVSIPDINISKHHAKFIFDETQGKYYTIDFGSRNGTYLNGKRLSVAKQESEPCEVVHGSILQVGGTKLLCHIHTGSETCGHCEPGLVQQKKSNAGDESTDSENKKHSHKKELRRIRKKFGLESLDTNLKAVPGYEDRAHIRRSTVGSQDHHEKTQSTSLEVPIQSDNKGFKLLTKMGWSEGQVLGKNGDGNAEPVPLVFRQGDKAGLGSTSGELLGHTDNSATERKKALWRKTQKRYESLT